MAALISTAFLVAAYVLVRCADMAYGYAVAKSYVRTIAYTIIAILALLAVVVMLFHL